MMGLRVGLAVAAISLVTLAVPVVGGPDRAAAQTPPAATDTPSSSTAPPPPSAPATAAPAAPTAAPSPETATPGAAAPAPSTSTPPATPATPPAAPNMESPAPAAPPPAAPNPESVAPQTPPSATPPGSEPPPVIAAPKTDEDAFGAEVTLEPKTVVTFQGKGNWDSAFETVQSAFRAIDEALARAGVKPSGPPMVIYLDSNDNGFTYRAAVPVESAPNDDALGDFKVGQSPAGAMLKFTHRGSYDTMDMTYEAITNFLESKNLDAKDLFIEEYVTDPLTTPENKLVINVYVRTQ